MTTIRPLEPDDLDGVARLVRSSLRGWRRDSEVLSRNLIDHPWVSRPPRSLVAVDDSGALIGSVGAQSRRLRFDGGECEGVCVSHLVVDADRRGGAAGVLLIRSLLSGDQEITWTDSGTPDVVRIWRMFGGDLDHARTCDWMLVLRPRRWARRIAGDGARRLAGIAASPGGWAGRDVAPIRAFPFPARRQSAEGGAADNKVETAHLSISDLASELGDVAREIRVLVDHDEPYLSYLFSYLEDTLSLQNEIVRNSVRRNGRVIGWYAYLVRPAVSRVIHIGASAREAEHVTAALLEDARSRGTEVLSGRLEPHLDAPLRNRGALLALSQQPLVHSNNADLRAAWGSSASLITEIDLIDSEWW